VADGHRFENRLVAAAER